jgi:hypothetical protein
VGIRALPAALAVKNFHEVGGSMFDLWPLFSKRDNGKQKEMSGTQHDRTLKTQFLHYITIKMALFLLGAT